MPEVNIITNQSVYSGSAALRNFVAINGSFHYVLGSYKIQIFDKNWILQRNISMINQSLYMSAVDDAFLFISENNRFCKANLNGTIILCFNRGNSSFRSSYYNFTSQTISVVSYSNRSILTFDKNLNLIEVIQLNYVFHGINAYFNDFILSDSAGRIIVLRNKVVINTFQTLCTSTVTQIYVNKNGLITVPCFGNQTLFLYHVNGSYMGKKVSVPDSPIFLSCDLNGNIAVVAFSNIYIIR